MDVEGSQRLDSFPYRSRVRDVMSAPALTCPPSVTVAKAARLMADRGVSSLIVVADDGGTPIGILTERDVLHLAASGDAGALARPVESAMGRPVHTVPANAFIYLAIARMDRFGVRHLAVTDAAGKLVGVVSVRALLKLRARTALVLGDQVQTAADAGAMAEALALLPSLARGLVADGVAARDVARVVSGVMRDASARAAELAEAAMAANGRGRAPAPYAVLVLGSAGRGESLLAPDQDNALVHGGSERDDGWFAELGRRMCAILDSAGIPYCTGKVMAQEPPWRRTREGWRAAISDWVRTPAPEDLLNVDIFYDFRPVHGDRTLAEALRDDATRAAASSPLFLRLLAANLESMNPPFGLFGMLRTDAGRVDLKRGGLMPIVTAARIMALKRGSTARGTPERLAVAATGGALTDADRAALDAAHGILLGLTLDQQLADIAEGVRPSTRVAVGRLDRPARRRLKEALRQAAIARDAVRDVLTAD